MMSTKHTLLLLIRLLQECLEEDYTVEELRSKIRDMLRLLGVYEELQGLSIRRDEHTERQGLGISKDNHADLQRLGIKKDKEGDVAIPIPSYTQSL